MILKAIIGINKDNNIDNDTKHKRTFDALEAKRIFDTLDDYYIVKAKRIFDTLEDNYIVVDDCDIIKRDLIDIYNVDNINIKLIKEL